MKYLSKGQNRRRKKRLLNQMAIRVEVELERPLGRDALLDAALKSTKGHQAIAEAGAQYIRSRLGLYPAK